VLEPRDFELWHGTKRALRFRLALGAVTAVRSRLLQRDYDLVEFFGGEFGLATKRLARGSQRPLIVAHTDGFELLASERERAYDPLPRTLAGSFRRWYRDQTHDRLSIAAFRYADAFVTGCELDRRRVMEMRLFRSERTAVISPGLDDEYLAARSESPNEKRIAYVGSWISRKGIGKTVEVMNLVLAERPELRLDLYGTGGGVTVLGSFSPAVRSQIAVHGRLTNREVADGLTRASVFFFPSQYEGFGMALAEAMACGCAPVTTPTGFGAELRNGEEALVCGFDDTPAMGRAIRALLDDNSLRARIAAAARNRVRTLAWETQIGKLEATYRSWLETSVMAGKRRVSA